MMRSREAEPQRALRRGRRDLTHRELAVQAEVDVHPPLGRKTEEKVLAVRVRQQQGLPVEQRGGLREAALRARQPKRLAVAEPADEVNGQPVNRVTFGQGTAFLGAG
jgi:hypothetical protein